MTYVVTQTALVMEYLHGSFFYTTRIFSGPGDTVGVFGFRDPLPRYFTITWPPLPRGKYGQVVFTDAIWHVQGPTKSYIQQRASYSVPVALQGVAGGSGGPIPGGGQTYPGSPRIPDPTPNNYYGLPNGQGSVAENNWTVAAFAPAGSGPPSLDANGNIAIGLRTTSVPKITRTFLLDPEDLSQRTPALVTSPIDAGVQYGPWNLQNGGPT